MKDQDKTKEQLLRELGELRQLIAAQTETEADLRNSVRDLQQREYHWNLVPNNERDIVYFQSLDGTYLSVNSAVEPVLGYTPDEFQSLSFRDILHPDYIPLIEEHLAAVLSGARSPDTFVVLARSKSNESVWLDVCTTVVRKDGKPVGLQGMARNISGRRMTDKTVAERKKAEEALHRERVRFSMLSEHAPFGLILTDKSGAFRYVNPRFVQMFGYHLTDVPDGKRWFDLAYPDPDYRHEVTQAWVDYTRSPGMGSGQPHVFTVRCKDGTEKIVQFRPVSLVGGEYMITCEDITELRRAEEALQESERRHRSLVETARDLIWTVDLDLQYTYVSPSVKDVLGFSADETLSTSAMTGILPSSRELVQRAFSEELGEDDDEADDEPSSRVLEVQHYHKDGSVVWVEMTVAPLREKNGKAFGLLGISRDITERKLMHEELQQALTQATLLRAEAEAANRAKSEFLANMSHELRTPMNAIIGFSEILEDRTFGSLNENQSKYVRLVLSSGYHLLQLINDILDLAKIESGKMPLNLSTVAVGRLLQSSLTMVQEKAVKQGIELGLEIPPELESMEILADKVKVKQILFNLLSNATKFTPHGGKIDLRAMIRGGELIMSVSDTGIGLNPEDRDRIFGAFEQVDSSYSRNQQGSGLGLALSRKLADMHGGLIWAKSAGQGKGSTFSVSIPLTRPNALRSDPWGRTDISNDPAPRGSGISPSGQCEAGPNVLVVEDDPITNELIADCLTESGYSVTQAYDGDQAIEQARRTSPFAITLDVVMPKKGGFDVLIELKATPETRDIPVILVTGSPDRELGSALGAFEFLEKPVNRERLLEVLDSLAPRQEHQSVRVLVIDDEPHVVELMSALLRPSGYEVLSAYSGRQGLEVAFAQVPDVVILDLMMPGMSGFEVAKYLGQHPRTQKIPILLYTSMDVTGDDVQRLRSSVHAVVPKAGGQQPLLDCLEQLRRSSPGS